MRYKVFPELLCRLPFVGQGMGIGGHLAANAKYTIAHERSIMRGLELGMSFVDTAAIYGRGQAEELLGNILLHSKQREQVVVATKFSPEDNAPQSARRALEKSLRRLNSEYVDLYQMHWPNPLVPFEETIGAMVSFIKEGKVKSIGLCNCSLKQLKFAQKIAAPIKISTVQVEYNLFDRSVELQMLPYCAMHNMVLVGYSPLLQGGIANGVKQRACLEALANKYGCTPAQLTLRWLVEHKPVIVIPNSSTILHVEENAASADLDIEQEDFMLIDRVCSSSIQTIDVSEILVNDSGLQAYRTVEEALENRFGHSPSAAELAEEILQDEEFKPVRVRCLSADQKNSGFEYLLLDGRSRFWAWIIAYGFEKPIPAYVKES